MPPSIEQLDARQISLAPEQNPGQSNAVLRRASDCANQFLARHYTGLKIVSNAKGEGNAASRISCDKNMSSLLYVRVTRKQAAAAISARFMNQISLQPNKSRILWL